MNAMTTRKSSSGKVAAFFAAVATGMSIPTAALAASSISVDSVTQRWPWNNKVDITYTVTDGANHEGGVYAGVEFTITVPGRGSFTVPGPTAETGGTGSRQHTFAWSAPSGIKATDCTVTATLFPTNAPANDYMIIDLDSGDVSYERLIATQEDSNFRYNTDEFKTTKMVLRKIAANGVTWQMGSTSAETTVSNTSGSGDDRQREIQHSVTLDKNFYIGVFEVTQKQWKMLDTTAAAYFTADRDMRPMENVCFNEIRTCAIGSTAEDAAYRWPERPNPASFLGKLRDLTGGIDFDLPSEAQWEFACRAGNGDCFWNNGLPMVLAPFTNKSTNYIDSNLNLLARYYGQTKNTSKPAASTAPEAGGTAIVGTYRPNSWGIYDMHGNVMEYCLDAFKPDISSDAGAVNLGTGGQHRGGSYRQDARRCRAARRDSANGPTYRFDNVGLRVICTTGLN